MPLMVTSRMVRFLTHFLYAQSVVPSAMMHVYEHTNDTIVQSYNYHHAQLSILPQYLPIILARTVTTGHALIMWPMKIIKVHMQNNEPGTSIVSRD